MLSKSVVHILQHYNRGDSLVWVSISLISSHYHINTKTHKVMRKACFLRHYYSVPNNSKSDISNITDIFHFCICPVPQRHGTFRFIAFQGRLATAQCICRWLLFCNIFHACLFPMKDNKLYSRKCLTDFNTRYQFFQLRPTGREVTKTCT